MPKPILCILGSTATGKSKLAIQLALRFNGEIISADSMQLYKGLDIVSNKVNEDEQKLAKHHFLNILEPNEFYTVSDFKRQADCVIKELHDKNKLPIIVGGTYYYIESILYDNLIQTESNLDDNLVLAKENQNIIKYTDQDLESVENFFKHEIRTFSFDNVDSIKLHHLLRQVDEDAANRLHPNDKRKIVRALQVYQKANTKYSELLKKQHKSGGQAKISGKLRFQNSLLLYLNIEKSKLNERIDQRIDVMLERGLLQELTDFFDVYNEMTKHKQYDHLDYRKGIFQIIGFKEFADYFNYTTRGELNGKKVTDKKLIDSDEIKKNLIKKGVNNLRVMTKKYSKTQSDWFKHRICANINRRPTPPIYSFNVNDLDKWDGQVVNPASEIVYHILIQQKSIFDLPKYLNQYRVKEYEKIQNDKKLRYCEFCNKTIVDDIVWQSHINSKKHRINFDRYSADKRKQKKIFILNKLKLICNISLAIVITSLIAAYFTNK